MSNFLRWFAVSATLLFMLSAVGVSEGSAQGPGPLREVLKRMEDHYQKLSSLKASVKMDKFNSQLGEHDVSEGTTIYIPQKGKDALVRVDWSKPLQESLAVVNKVYVLYRPHLKQAIKGNVGSGKVKEDNAFKFLNMSRAQLQANYTVNYIGVENVEGGTATWHLELIPKMASRYKSADLWVDKDGMPIQAKVVENNNDATTVLLSNLQKNITIRTSDIQIQLPKGTKIVDG
jgi:outer membrane lipoprotein-sorting protein